MNILNAFWNILHSFLNILEHSAYILEHSGTFWSILHAFWNILEHSGTFCIHSGTFCIHSWTFCIYSGTFCMHSDQLSTDKHTDIRTCWAASSQPKKKIFTYNLILNGAWHWSTVGLVCSKNIGVVTTFVEGYICKIWKRPKSLTFFIYTPPVKGL